MIITNINSYNNISEHKIIRVLDYVKSHNLINEPLGRIDIDGDDIFINNVERLGVKKEEQFLELHREYIDVHILLAGKETIGWKLVDSIKNYSQTYNVETECALSAEMATNYYMLNEGDVFIAYPHDAHAPMIGNGIIRKIIAKIRIDK